ncbi:MAG: hypothetical protein ACKO96_43835, partial [Flammeovirgaceae bacterium]
MESTIKINNKSFKGGRNVIIANGRVIIDGSDVTPGDDKAITISVSGNVDKLEVDHCNLVSVVGDVGSIKTKSGDVEIKGNVN